MERAYLRKAIFLAAASLLVVFFVFCLNTTTSFADEYDDEDDYDYYDDWDDGDDYDDDWDDDDYYDDWDDICYHDWLPYVGYETKKYNSEYHMYVDEECYDCGAYKWKKEKHDFEHNKVIKYATPKAKGKVKYRCLDCGYIKTKTVKWKRGKYGCKKYDISTHSTVSRNTRTVTVRLKNSLKGSKLKIKIGKKTYTKKIKSNKKKAIIKVKIRKPRSYGNKVKVWVTYKGKTIGKDQCSWDQDVVWYASKIRRGMTKKQVKYTWGSADDKASSSGGWSYWYYDDGSYIGFKHGKVRYWYDAEK